MTRPQNSRAVDPRELAVLVPDSIVKDDIQSAIAYARDHAPKGTPVLVCGSLYLIGEARAVLH
jgi:folylpolyglutamate synthase/dihydropteroate synthase